MAQRKSQFVTIRTEGALLPPDILQRIGLLKVDGTDPESFHLPPGSKLNEAISQSWTSLLTHWQAFHEAREQLPDSDETGTAVTNERWLLPLFKELDYGRLVTTKSPEIDERVYPIERFYNHTPIHLIGCRLPLDRRTKGARGAATASPHSMVQEYLNRSDQHVWAFLSNGLQLRILRDNISLSRQAFVEFDLEAMMEGEVYADFALLWLLCHQSRVESEKPQDCWLEKWSQLAREEGTRVLKDLRVGVAKAIEALGRGFIGHPRNDRLREKLHTGALTKDDYYRQLLRIVYRLLFLFVAEDRELLHPPLPQGEGRGEGEKACNLYDSHYSTRRLRDLALKMRGSKHADLWHSLSLVFDVLGKNEGCPQLALCGLGSFLWRASSTADLLGPHQTSSPSPSQGEGRGEGSEATDPVLITNDDLLQAIRELAYVEQDRVLRMVDYRNLGSEELGSVYEALLELHPVMNVEAKSFELLTAAGNERKITGSYYTPDSLVQCLLDSALDPVLADRLKGKKGEDAEQAILDMKVCDPACGSGHFLMAAAHRLARHLARARTGETEPSPEDYQHALRDIIGRCVYGVDLNPMAVELCKVSLWMEAIEPGKPLSFLDHHIQCGNSLLGTTPALLAKGIPDDAFKPIEGDVKAVCNELKRENKRQRQEYESGQGYLFAPLMKLGNLPATITQINVADDDSLEDVAAKQEMYERMVKGADYLNARLLADLWCAAFVWKKDKSDLGQLCPTERYFRNIENNPHSILPHVKSEVRRLADQYQFFHWHLAFPDVFRLPEEGRIAENKKAGWNRGFDVVLGNPPWERIQLEKREFFAEERPDIAEAPAKTRDVLLQQLEAEDPVLFRKWQDASRNELSQTQFIKNSDAFTLTSTGNLNTFALFVELAASQIHSRGMVGMIVPSGLVTEASCQQIFRHLIHNNQIASVFDFENSGELFPNVHRSYRFSLVSLTASSNTRRKAKFYFFLKSISDMSSEDKCVQLDNEDIAAVNPNSRTCPPVSSRKDMEILLAIHASIPVLDRDLQQNESNPWTANSKQMLNATHDRRFFEQFNGSELAAVSECGRLCAGEDEFLKLYEGKMLNQFDHRFSTYDEDFETVQTTNISHANPRYQVLPKYWVPTAKVRSLLPDCYSERSWMLTFRAIARSTDQRTIIASAVPLVGLVHAVPALYSSHTADTQLALLGTLNSFVLDFVARLKMSGTHVSHFILKQLPIATPTAHHTHLVGQDHLIRFVRDRVLELTYTAWDLEAFALDCGYDGPPFRWDEERRFLLRSELDAAYFHLYLGSPSEWGADSPQLREMFPTPRHAVDYIMETFPIVRRKDIARTEIKNDSGQVTTEGRYITKDTILEMYDQMQQAIDTGQRYQTRLNPQPGPPTDAEGNFIPMAEWDCDNWPLHVHAPRESAV